MKQQEDQNRQQKRGQGNLPKPENKDNLDSRKEKEEGYKDNNNKQGRKPNTKNKNEAGH